MWSRENSLRSVCGKSVWRTRTRPNVPAHPISLRVWCCNFKAGAPDKVTPPCRVWVAGSRAFAAALPLISIINERWGFDTWFYVLSAAAP